MDTHSQFRTAWRCAIVLWSLFAWVLDSGDAKELKLGFGGGWPPSGWDVGPQALIGFQLAVEDVNADNANFPDVQFTPSWKDLACDAAVGLQRFAEMRLEDGIELMIGAGCSTVSGPLGLLAPLWEMPVISWGSTSPSLSNTGLYPTFFRTVAPDTSVASAWVQILQDHGFTRVGCIYELQEIFALVFGSFVAKAEAAGISVVAVETFPGGSTDLTQQMKNLKSKALSVFFAGAYKAEGLYLMLEAQRFGLTGEGYQWFGTDSWSTIEFFDTEGTLGERNEEWDARALEAAEGLAGFQANPGEGPRAEEFIQRFQVRAQEEADAEGREPYAFDVYSPFAYDAVFVYANALQQLANDGKELTSANVLELLPSTNFEGVTGMVSFDENGDRKPSYILMNIQNGKHVRIGTYTESEGVSITGTFVYGGGVLTPPTTSECLSGYVTDPLGGCVPCAPGLFSNNGTCEACPVGHYNPESAQTSCLQCPVGKFQNAIGNLDCFTCSLGEYQDEEGSETCKSCPANTNTCKVVENVATDGTKSYSEQCFIGATHVNDCICKEGFWSRHRNATCETCPEGGVCCSCAEIGSCVSDPFGDECTNIQLEPMLVSLKDAGAPCGACSSGADPIPSHGHYRSSKDPELFLKCFPESACRGGPHNTCLGSSEGDMCSDCAVGYYRLDGDCEKCPDGDNSGALIGICIAAFFVPMIFVKNQAVSNVRANLNKTKEANQALRQLSSVKLLGSVMGEVWGFMQVMSLFRLMELDWPDEILSIFTVFSAFNINAELLRPECAGGNDWFTVWYTQLGIPIYFLVPFSVPVLISWVRSKLKKQANNEENAFSFRAEVNAVIRGYTMFLFLVYLPICTNIVQPISCTRNTDGIEYMNSQRHIPCSFDNPDWTKAFFVSIFLTFLFAICFPIGICFTLYRVRMKMNDMNVSQRFGHFYEKYEKRWFWWDVVNCMRKFGMLLSTTVLFTSTPVKQCLLTLLVLFIAIFMQLFARPYEVDMQDVLVFQLNISTCALLFFGLLFLSDLLDAQTEDILLTCSYIILSAIIIMVGYTLLMALKAICCGCRSSSQESEDGKDAKDDVDELKNGKLSDALTNAKCDPTSDSSRLAFNNDLMHVHQDADDANLHPDLVSDVAERFSNVANHVRRSLREDGISVRLSVTNEELYDNALQEGVKEADWRWFVHMSLLQ